MLRDFSPDEYGINPEDGYPVTPASAHYRPEQFGPRILHGPFRIATQAALETDSVMREFEAEFPSLVNPELPVSGYREQIMEAVRDNPVTIVVAETGSGKSTQIPKMLIEEGYEVTQSQPRRMASRMVADRIQYELTEVLGEQRAAGMVGFQTAETSTITDDTRISVITDGIQLLKQLNEPVNDGVKRVYMLDEVHEWNVNLEVAVALVKERVARDPNVKFVLTSATMDAHRLSAFFADVTERATPVIEVPGRTHQIERLEKPESTVLDEIIASATENPEEDILVFLPGKREIADTIDALHRWLPDDIRSKATILPLHAKLSPEQQDRVNQQTDGIKIVVATNVAQTSLTIDGIDVVIDSGMERRVELDEEGVEGLRILPVSQADCDQRAGRTGRVGPGRYILTRYSDDLAHVPYMNRQKYPQAEILRTDINRTVLRTAAAGIDIAGLDLFHPLDFITINNAKNDLYNLGALDQHGLITKLGSRMNEFPLQPSSGRMLMEALPFSERVRAQLAAVVSAIEVGGLPYYAPDVGKAWQHLTDETSSDLLAQLDLFIAAADKTDKELVEYDLDVQAVRRAQELYRKVMHRGNVGEVELEPPTVAERQLLEQAICAGLIDSVYKHVGGGHYKRVGSSGDTELRELSNRSVLNGSRPGMVVGRPYRVEFMHGGEPVTRHILENVTAVQNARVLGRVAAEHMLSWQPEQFVWRNGVLRQVMGQVFNGTVKLGASREVDAINGEESASQVRDMIMEHPGPAQRELRDIKSELQRLRHLTRRELPQVDQSELLSLLDEAMAQAGELDQSRIDNVLREMMIMRGISLDQYVSPADRNQIIENAPPEITVPSAGVRLPVSYRRGMPIARQYDPTVISGLSETVRLPDQREVLFLHDGRYLTLAQLQNRLAPVPA